MSFRAFIYYCALCGGCTAFLGWALGRFPLADAFLRKLLHIQNETALAIGTAAFQGMLLGMLIAFGIGVLDAMLSFSGTRFLRLIGRIFVAVVVGGLGGVLGGAVGQAFVALFQFSSVLASACTILGWMITGLLIGAAPGMYDLLESLLRREELRGAFRKLLHGLIGGGVGGLLGSLLFLLLNSGWHKVFHEKADDFWSPSATGFIALGMCIGLLIGLAQVVLKEAWLKIESGARSGREVILSKPAITIGRAEACDIGLFGDPTVERKHARILQQNDRYLLADEDTTGGTYLNGERIAAPVPLSSGDMIRVGNCTLRFGERQKRPVAG